MNGLKFLLPHNNKLYHYILCVTFFISNYLWFANLVSSIYLKPENNEIY